MKSLPHPPPPGASEAADAGPPPPGPQLPDGGCFDCPAGAR
ncbi:MAG: hypothetical protein ACYCWW_16335 [Deltaproteobacteria bacterium]